MWYDFFIPFAGGWIIVMIGVFGIYSKKLTIGEGGLVTAIGGFILLMLLL